jgi:hypothetical protein
MLAAAVRAVLLLASLLAALSARAGEPVVAEEVVAVVDARAILLSDLELETAIARARVEGPSALTATPTAAQLAEGLAHFVDKLVVYAEAERLQVFELGPGDLQKGVDELKARLGPALPQFLKAREVDEQSLRDVVRRELRMARYLDGRFRLASRPRDAEVQAFVAEHAEDFAHLPPADRLAQARERISREKFAALTSAFVADVRRRARVRVLRNFDAPGSQTPTSGTETAPESRRRRGT